LKTALTYLFKKIVGCVLAIFLLAVFIDDFFIDDN